MNNQNPSQWTLYIDALDGGLYGGDIIMRPAGGAPGYAGKLIISDCPSTYWADFDNNDN